MPDVYCLTYDVSVGECAGIWTFLVVLVVVLIVGIIAVALKE